MKSVVVAIVLFLALQSSSSAEGSNENSERTESAIGYESVEAALDALSARGDVQIRQQDGWTIISDGATRTLWSFTPEGHQAHPSVVKREVLFDDGKLSLNMNVLCQAEKAACEKLVAEFEELNREIRAKARQSE